MLIGRVSFAVDVVEGSDVPPDASVQLAMRGKRAVAITGSGVQLEELQNTGQARSKRPALIALLCKTEKHGVQYDGKLKKRGDGGYSAVLDVYLPTSVWRNPGIIGKSAPFAALFANLQSLVEPAEGSGAWLGGHPANGREGEDDPSHGALTPEDFTLASCFNALPQHASDVELPELQVDSTNESAGIADLDLPVIHKIVAQLPSRDVASLARTCRFFKALADEAIPDLKLTLYPHQRAAVRWMLQREEEARQIPDPCWREFRTQEGVPFWGCAVTGALRRDPPRMLLDTRGGLFCDEPGLGKTITGLGLMLRTRQTLASAPSDCKSHTMRSSRGKAIGYYLLPSPATAGRRRPQPGAGLPDETLRSTRRRSGGGVGPAAVVTSSSNAAIPTQTPPTVLPSKETLARAKASGWVLAEPKALPVSTPPVLPPAHTPGGADFRAAAPLPKPPVAAPLGPTSAPPSTADLTPAGLPSGGPGVDARPPHVAALPSRSPVQPSSRGKGAGNAGPSSWEVASTQQSSGVQWATKVGPAAAQQIVQGGEQAAADVIDLSPDTSVEVMEVAEESLEDCSSQTRGGAAHGVGAAPQSATAGGPPAEELATGEGDSGSGASVVAVDGLRRGKGAESLGSAAEGDGAGVSVPAAPGQPQTQLQGGRSMREASLPGGDGGPRLADPEGGGLCGENGLREGLPAGSPGLASCRAAAGGHVPVYEGHAAAALRSSGEAGENITPYASRKGAEAGAASAVQNGSARKRPLEVGEDHDDGDDPDWGTPGGSKPKKKKKAGKQGKSAPSHADLLWVQCEICGKWRSFPIGTKIDESCVWICQMHPEPAKADCSVREERFQDRGGMFESSAGFVAEGQAPGGEDNVRHFRQLLAGYPELVDEMHSALWWLSRQDPYTLLHSIQIPRKHLDCSPNTLPHLLTEMGFTCATRTPSKKPRPSEGGTPSSSIKRYTPYASTKPAYAVWKQPKHLGRLLLDTAAISHVLKTGVGEVMETVFLSPATLLVVPANLVQHWVFQVQEHVRFNCLKLLVISSDKERSNKMPSPSSLAWDYDLVITTMSQLSAAWSDRQRRSPSPFMQVHWLRLIVDEGHMLGNSLSMTSRLQMGCALKAERRWLMTGTPTPGGFASDTAHLQPLLAFLHDKPYGSEPHIWQEAVQKPFEAKEPVGRARLMALLSRIMIRASKDDLVTIPPCYSKVTVLDFSPEHAISYNLLVDVVHRNLLTSDWYDPDHHESLLNTQRNSKWAKEMLENIKKACCVSGNCDLVAKQEDVRETLELLSERLNLPTVEQHGPPWLPKHHRLAPLEPVLSSANMHISSLCQKCGSITRIPMITPCAHLLCSTCASEDKLKCPLPSCGVPYTQQTVDEPSRRLTNPNPKWDVPLELIEWQVPYTQRGAKGIEGGTWSENFQFTASTKCVHLLKRLYDIGAAESLTCPYAYPSLLKVRRDAGGRVLGGLAKAIIFSQFWIHINLVIHHLNTHNINHAVLRAGLPHSDKLDALDNFQNDDECGVLIMDSTGSVGLDLSFVSHVFLLEPLEDMSVYKQVVSRAHRLGAKGPVHVEILVMKGTAEEQLVRLTGQGGYSRVGMGRVAEELPLATLNLASPEKDLAKAQEVSRRNHILRAMRRVPEATLPEFEDLPV